MKKKQKCESFSCVKELEDVQEKLSKTQELMAKHKKCSKPITPLLKHKEVLEESV